MNTNKQFYNIINQSKQKMYEEKELAVKLKNSCSYDDDVIGVKITALTREKIFNLFIEIFKCIRYKKNDEVKELLLKVFKKIRLHIYQMKKLKQDNLEENKVYFKNMLLHLNYINKKNWNKI